MPAISTIIAGVGLAASIGGGIAQMSAQKKALKAQQAAAAQNQNLVTGNYNQIRQMYAPFVAGGQKSFDMFNNSTGVNGEGGVNTALDAFYKVSPDYAEALKVGTNNVLQTSANSGSLLSGARLKGVMNYGGSTFNQYLSQWRNSLLAGANVGMGAMNQTAAAGNNATNALTGINTDVANARASAYENNANTLNNMFQGIGDTGAWWAGKRFAPTPAQRSVGTVNVTPMRTGGNASPLAQFLPGA